MTVESSKKLDLESNRLLVSNALGTDFCELLEQEEQIELSKDREGYILHQLQLSTTKRHLEIQVDTIDEAALLLRAYRPEMILGSQKKTNIEVVSQIGSQLGMSSQMSSPSGISDRLIGREKVAIVMLNINNKKLDKKLKKIPENGILITVSKKG